ncbi:hypothetical protein H1R20_g5183, partial [Candolleomyces eurysporus]
MERKYTSMPTLPKLNTNVPQNEALADSALENTKQAPSTKLLDYFLEHVTFYRIHLAAFILIPLVTSGVFYASNGRFHISFIDSLFICYSSMTVTGLSTINLSTLTPWQQVILYFLMTIGDITIVSWVMVLIRKRYFRTHCEYVATMRKRRKMRRGPKRSRSMFLKSISSPIAAFRPQAVPEREKSNDEQLDNEGAGPDLSRSPELNGGRFTRPGISIMVPTPGGSYSEQTRLPRPPPTAIPEAPEENEDQPISDARTFSSSPAAASVQLPEVEQDLGIGMLSPVTDYGVTSGTDFGVTSLGSPRTVHYHPMMDIVGGRPQPKRGATMLTNRHTMSPTSHHAKDEGFGGFPGPVQLMNRLARRAAPRTYNKLERKLTITSYQTLDENQAKWLNFSGLIVQRNSDFRVDSLTDEQLEQVGGAEYGALRLLSYLVPGYFIGFQLLSFTLFAPWFSTTSQYDEIFEAQPRLVNKTWFSLFQVMAAYTGGGMSLVDMGMVPFQRAYLMVFGMMISILAGNHALPIFMRLIIWIMSKFTTDGTAADQALDFLLQHPRRCYLYLFVSIFIGTQFLRADISYSFPSHQTWFLGICLALFSLIEWGSFLVLNIGIPAYESIPAGVRVLAGLFQGLAARASGFSIVPLSLMAPALLFLYVVMMYIAIYPVALSIRSTNVYEERSLGVFEAPPDDEDEEPAELNAINSRNERIGRYLGWHLRRQMSIDIWWLVWAVFLVCIIERGNLMDEEKKWFDVFRVIFELVSAFGGIGLTLGDNFSFVGSFKPLSKLIVIIIMIRGRHRGLPVAVDRAVQLPKEMVTAKKPMQFNEKQPNSTAEAQEPNPIIRMA